MRDTESRDLAGAAYLAREADAYDDDRPSRSDLAYDATCPNCGCPMDSRGCWMPDEGDEWFHSAPAERRRLTDRHWTVIEAEKNPANLPPWPELL